MSQEEVRDRVETKFRKAAVEALCEGVCPLRLTVLLDLAKKEADRMMGEAEEMAG